jgi:crossover junction endodeoxyribonuclease RuvC
MIILGIDPGSNATGYGLIRIDAGRKIHLIEAGTITPKATESLVARIEKIHRALTTIIDSHAPRTLVLEELYSHYKHPITAVKLGHVRGVVCLAAVQKNLDLVEYSVKRVRKMLVGNGNATKVQTQRVVAHVLGIRSEKLTLDASDALALALGHAYREGGMPA